MQDPCGLCQPFQLMDIDVEEHALDQETNSKANEAASLPAALLATVPSLVDKDDKEEEKDGKSVLMEESGDKTQENAPIEMNSVKDETSRELREGAEEEGKQSTDDLREVSNDDDEEKAKAVETLIVSVNIESTKHNRNEGVETAKKDPVKKLAESTENPAGNEPAVVELQKEIRVGKDEPTTPYYETLSLSVESRSMAPPSLAIPTLAIGSNLTSSQVLPATPSIAKSPRQSRFELPERDFDINPTELYLALQRKEWNHVMEIMKSSPQEARVWIFRKEVDGRLRWRLLPIHASIIFLAPLAVIDALLAAFPDGARARDDQGMLPLHLSFRMGSEEEVVQLLIDTFPGSLEAIDRKGRTPKVIAEKSSGPNKAAFLRAIEKGPRKKSNAIVSSPKPRQIKDELALSPKSVKSPKSSSSPPVSPRSPHSTKNLPEVQQKVQKTDSARQLALEKEVESLQLALKKSKETSKVLVDHIASLEDQLSKRTETEKFLANNLPSPSSNEGRTPEMVETTYKTVLVKLNLDKHELTKQVETLQSEKEVATKALKETIKTLEAKKVEWSETNTKQEEMIRNLEEDCKNLRTDVLVLEKQLKTRAEAEKSLTAQVANLVSQLQAASDDTGMSTTSFTSRVRGLEMERDALRFSVDRLSKKMYSIAGLLDCMSKEQANLIEEALGHENQAAIAACSQANLLAEVKEHAELIESAKIRRDHIVELLNQHLGHMEESLKDKKTVLEAIEDQAHDLASTSEQRLAFIQRVTNLKERMGSLLDSVYEELPKDMVMDINSTSSSVVDQVVEKIMKSHKDEIVKNFPEPSPSMIPEEDDEKEEEIGGDVPQQGEKDTTTPGIFRGDDDSSGTNNPPEEMAGLPSPSTAATGNGSTPESDITTPIKKQDEIKSFSGELMSGRSTTTMLVREEEHGMEAMLLCTSEEKKEEL